MKKFKAVASLCAAVLCANALAASGFVFAEETDNAPVMLTSAPAATGTAGTEKTAAETTEADKTTADTTEADKTTAAAPASETFSISYDADGGIGKIDEAVSAAAGAEVKLSVWALKKDGYVHNGWTDGEKVYQRGETIVMPDHDLKLTAVFSKLYSLTYSEECSEYKLPFADKKIPAGTEIKIDNFAIYKGNAKYRGLLMNGVYYPQDSVFVMPEEDVQAEIYWLSPVTITYWSGDYEGVGNEPKVTAEKYPGLKNDLEDTSKVMRRGYSMTGWRDLSTGTEYKIGDSFIIPDHDTTLLALWAPDFITVTYNLNGGSGKTKLSSAKYDTFITLHDGEGLSKSGCRLLGWESLGRYYEPGKQAQVKNDKVGASAQFTAVWGSEGVDFGDLNGDGLADLTDLTLLSLHLIGADKITDEQLLKNADVYKDEIVDIADLAHFKRYLTKDYVLLGMEAAGEEK